MKPAYIHYIELKSDGARAQLLQMAEELRLCVGFLDAALLYSEPQGIWLLESRWQTMPPELTWPVEAKAWAFGVREFVSGEKR